MVYDILVINENISLKLCMNLESFFVCVTALLLVIS